MFHFWGGLIKGENWHKPKTCIIKQGKFSPIISHFAHSSALEGFTNVNMTLAFIGKGQTTRYLAMSEKML